MATATVVMDADGDTTTPNRRVKKLGLGGGGAVGVRVMNIVGGGDEDVGAVVAEGGEEDEGKGDTGGSLLQQTSHVETNGHPGRFSGTTNEISIITSTQSGPKRTNIPGQLPSLVECAVNYAAGHIKTTPEEENKAENSSASPIGTIPGVTEQTKALEAYPAKAAKHVKHDGAVHDPLGAGAYAYERDFTSPQLDYLGLPTIHHAQASQNGAGGTEWKLLGPTTLYVHVKVNIRTKGASPHAGIMSLIGYAFLHAKGLKAYYESPKVVERKELTDWNQKFTVELRVELADLKGRNVHAFTNDGVEYRQDSENSPQDGRDGRGFVADVEALVREAAAYVGESVQWRIIEKASNLSIVEGIDAKIFSQVIQVILNNKERLGKELFPKTESLVIRRPCPQSGCGITEADGKRNVYVKSKGSDRTYETIEFHCPKHGYHAIHLNNPDELEAIEFGPPLDNLVRILAYGLETSNARATAQLAVSSGTTNSVDTIPVHLYVTGTEWSGTYNESLLWRQLLELAKTSPTIGNIALPVIAYVPTISDWAGSRLSTSLIQQGYYQYLKEADQGYVLSFAEMKRQGKDVKRLFETIEGWMKSPFKLFRPYSIEYIRRIAFERAETETAKVEQVAAASQSMYSDTGRKVQFEAVHDDKLLDPPGQGAEFYGTEYISAQIKHLGLPTANDIRNLQPVTAVARNRDCGLRRGFEQLVHWVKQTFQAILGYKSDPSVGGTKGEIFLPTTLIVHTGAQPNNSPHAGTLTVFVLTFLHAREIKRYYSRLRETTSDPTALQWLDSLEVVVQLNLVDTAPDKKQSQISEGLEYQRSQRFTKKFHELEPDYDEVMNRAAEFVGGDINWRKEYQAKLTGMKNVPKIVEIMLDKRATLGWEISPKSGDLGMRRACPAEGCGFAEKHGRKTHFERLEDGSYKLNFFCFQHGNHVVHTSNAKEVESLEFNTPLRNLLRGLAYGLETTEQRAEVLKNIRAGIPAADAGRVSVHLRVTGSDYTGTYSEQLFWRQLFLLSRELETAGLGPLTTPVIAYAPLILDWSGSKISKSLYVKKGAYEYLKENGMGYFLSYADMKAQGKDIEALFEKVEEWVMNPKGLFRPYSVDYLHGCFERREASLAERGQEVIA